MYLADHARLTPDKPALISADTGRVVTFAQLDERALRMANLFRDRGLKRGDHVALLMENNLAFMDAAVDALFRGFVAHRTGGQEAVLCLADMNEGGVQRRHHLLHAADENAASQFLLHAAQQCDVGQAAGIHTGDAGFAGAGGNEKAVGHDGVPIRRPSPRKICDVSNSGRPTTAEYEP